VRSIGSLDLTVFRALIGHLAERRGGKNLFSTNGANFMKRLAILFFLFASPLFGQINMGELRLKVSDPAGIGVKVTVLIVSEANQYRNSLATSDQGMLDLQRLPYGIYQLQITQAGFAPVSETLEIRSSIATEFAIQLKLPSVNQSVTVTASDTLIDPDRVGAVSEIGSDTIQHRLSSLPGRSLQDLVNSRLRIPDAVRGGWNSANG
jgi:hypothetical protein